MISRRLCICALVVCLLSAAAHCEESKDDGDFKPCWKSWGGGNRNARSASAGHKHPHQPTGFHREWFYNTSSAVTASPTTTGDHLLYFTSYGGQLICAHRFSGKTVWDFNVTAFLAARGVPDDGITLTGSRTSPTVTAGYVFIGTQRGALLIKLNRFTGALVWATQLSAQTFAIVTQSPRVYNRRVYVGVSSAEEFAALLIPGLVEKFVGTFSAVDAVSGEIVWTFRTLPAGGYAGGAVWGSEPPIDVKRGQVILATGNPYRVPPKVEACRVRTANQTVTFPDPCRAAGDYSESVVALDLATGRVNWHFSLSPVEAWTYACGVDIPELGIHIPINPVSCPEQPGPDIDFGQAPILVEGAPGVTPRGRDTLFVGQKSGIVWALDAATGAVHWSTATGNGGKAGGMMFGSASDGLAFFYAQTNAGGLPYTLADGSNTTSGHVGSLSLLDGRVRWQTPLQCVLLPPLSHAYGAVFVPCGQLATGPTGGQLHVLSVRDGSTLFQWLDTPGAYVQGVSIVGENVYAPLGATLATAITSGGGVVSLKLHS